MEFSPHLYSPKRSAPDSAPLTEARSTLNDRAARPSGCNIELTDVIVSPSDSAIETMTAFKVNQARNRAAILALILYTAAVCVVNYETLRELLAYAATHSAGTHTVLIPAVAIGLLWLRWTEISHEAKPSWGAGAALALFGAVVARIEAPELAAWALSLSVAGTLLTWIAGFLGVLGCRAMRRAMFPLGFLVFAIPLPEQTVAQASHFLKWSSAETLAALYAFSSTAYHREGYTFLLPGAYILVGDECSGIRSTFAMIMTSLLLAQTYLSGPWRRALFVLAALPVSILKNGLRILCITLLTIHVDPGFLTGRLHQSGGMLFFIVGLGIQGALLLLLRRNVQAMPSLRAR